MMKKSRVILRVDDETAEFLGKTENKSAFVREAINNKIAGSKCAIENAKETNESAYSIIRCTNSGVFFGKVESLKGQTAKIKEARQIWYWDGAKNVMQIAKDGVNENSQITQSADVIVTDAIQIVPCSPKAEACLKGAKEWKI